MKIVQTSHRWGKSWATGIAAIREWRRRRNEAATPVLRGCLKRGDKIRATKVECGAREATFTFSHWEGGWIVSIGNRSIAPASVYSVNGTALRF